MPELRCLILLAGLGLACNSLAAGQDEVLQTNPFLRPALAAPAQPGIVQAETPDTVTLDLRATMVAGSMSQANIGGKIVGLGEEVNGYRLLEVHVRRVVLEREGTRREIAIAELKQPGRD
ncbi:MAG: hypothetical protein R3308_07415 [Thiohalobacterales bacterium]|nr:hypothetical protein [Thiohalobacterales bacterium]